MLIWATEIDEMAFFQIDTKKVVKDEQPLSKLLFHGNG